MLTPSLSIIYPPNPRNISKKEFFCAFFLSLLDKIKVGGDSCLLRHFEKTNAKRKPAFQKTVSSSHRITPSNIIVRAFDGSKRMVHVEVDIPIKVGTETFNSTFYVMDIHPSYSCLLGRPWIHNAGAVTSTLHQMLKYPVHGQL